MGLTPDEYPRLLLVGTGLFIPHTGGGITLSNLFRGWPLDRIAAIHFDTQAYETDVCENFYRLSNSEMGWVWPFSMFAGQRGGSSSSSGQAEPGQDSPSRTAGGGASRWRRYARAAYRAIAEEGLRDRATVSEELRKWLREFQPEVIYSWLGTLGYIRLVRQIADLTGAGIVLHIMDDWPATSYRKGLAAGYFRRQMEQGLRSLFDRAAVCLGICPGMCRAYEARYGRPFHSFSNALNMDQWLEHARRDWARPELFRILYSGSIVANAQLESLRDICRTVAQIAEEGHNLEFVIHSAGFYADQYREELEQHRGVRLAAPLGDLEVARTLAEADLLALPVNFDKDSVRYIRYSNPTKLPAYLISGTPILAYGPEGVDQIDRARDEEWGCVVNERSLPRLKEALVRLMEDDSLRARLGSRGQQVARKNHDIRTVGPAFHEAIARAARR